MKCSKGCIPTRATIWVMVFTSCFVSYMLRVNMSVNLIAMAEPSKRNKTLSECVEPKKNKSHSEVPDYGPRYEWSSKVRGQVLGSYFWGYAVSSMPGGLIAERVGPVKTVAVSTLISAGLTLGIPVAASYHYGAVMALRILLGAMGGVIYPALHSLIARWVPPLEKGKFVGALLGGTLGTVVTWPALGEIIENWGWIWGFYIPGGISFVWCVLWFFLVTDTPDKHPRISEEERTYIRTSLGGTVTDASVIPPYKSIFLSIPFLSMMLLHFGGCWGLYLLLTEGPHFMNDALGFKIRDSGFLAACPYLARMTLGVIFGLVGDYIRKSERFSVTCIRKSFVLLSHIIPGGFLIAQTVIGCDVTLSVLFITLALGFNGASTLTNLQNSQDLAPNFAGTMYGIINAVGSLTGIITPVLTGYLNEEYGGLDGWHMVFWIGGGVYIGSGIVFCILGTGKQQPWNEIDDE